MDLKQAIELALDYEHKVRDHYAKGAEAIEDPKGKRVFEVLAREEQGHVDYLEECLREWTESGTVSSAALQPVVEPGVSWIEQARKALEQTPERRIAEDLEIELLTAALELETKTSAFYRELVGKLSKEHRELFDRFLEIEEGHVTIVQAELDAVQGLGFWFDVMEFKLEAG